MDGQHLIPHLFRTEFRKITAVLCRQLGMEHLDAAEDIAGETFLTALETWPFKGVPPNPQAWLYAVARNKARNYVARTRLFSSKIAREIESASVPTEQTDLNWREGHVQDSQLQMIFAVCHPTLNEESQVALALRVLCGFGITEIANAFLTGKETINKRLFRAKEKLRQEKVEMEFPSPAEMDRRLGAALKTLYLLFNEGYYSESADEVLREDLCLEAMQLTRLLLGNQRTNLPAVNALLAMMCFHSSRFPARRTANRDFVLYDEQDESLWDQDLIARGAYYLHEASVGKTLSKYHLEAAIAYWHTKKEDTRSKWDNILQLFDHLLRLEYSPVAALNRLYALAKVHGKHVAIEAAERTEFPHNRYYYALLGELYTGVDRRKAIGNLSAALNLANTGAERMAIQRKLDALLDEGG